MAVDELSETTCPHYVSFEASRTDTKQVRAEGSGNGSETNFLCFDVAVVVVFAGARNACSSNNGGCRHLCLLGVDSVKQCACATGFEMQSDGSCSPASTFIVAAMRNSIRGFHLDGSHADAMMPLASYGTAPQSYPPLEIHYLCMSYIFFRCSDQPCSGGPQTRTHLLVDGEQW